MAHPLTAAGTQASASPLEARRQALRARRRDRLLARATPAELATLERRGSALRHSAVEAVLQNLKLTAQACHEEPHHTRRLGDHLARVATLRSPIDVFFQRQRAGGSPLRLIFREEHWEIRRAIDRLGRLEPTRWEEVPPLVDRIMEGLRAVDRAIQARRVNPGALALEALELASPIAKAQRVSLRGDEGLAALPALHLDRALALDALMETVRNAVRHAFPREHRGERFVTALGAADSNGVEVRVEDTGCGMSAAERGVPGTHGTELIQRIMQSVGGEAGWEPNPGGGTSVSLRWPRHPPGTSEE